MGWVATNDHTWSKERIRIWDALPGTPACPPVAIIVQKTILLVFIEVWIKPVNSASKLNLKQTIDAFYGGKTPRRSVLNLLQPRSLLTFYSLGRF